jgi:GntR family transcriptional regulator/MocR family aminotransferase
MDLLFELPLDSTGASPRNMARWLGDQLKSAVLDGRLRPGTKLPPTRESQAFFGVSRNTAAEVYERLVNAGYLVTRRGSGTYVAESLPHAAPANISHRDSVPFYRMNEFWTRPDITASMDFWRETTDLKLKKGGGAAIDFRPALVDSRLFPFDVFRRVMSQQLRKLENKPASFKSPQGNQGNYFLRQAITDHIGLTRVVVCDEDDVVVTSGAQQAFDLLARILVTANQTVVALEDPGYPPLRVAFAAAGAKLVPVPVDDEGLVVDRIPPDAKIICISPSHQFPTGVTMSARRRKELISFARNCGAVIIEDDYDGEFRYEGGALEALRTADAADVVFYVGTFSKCMLPALRLGFIVTPRWARRTLVSAKNCLDWHCPIPIQIGVAGFISEGHLARHVRRLRQSYRQRRQLLLQHLEEDLGPWLEPIPSYYGLHVSAIARDTRDLEAVAATLERKHIKIHTFSRYYLGPPTGSGLVFGYGAVSPDQVTKGLSALRSALATKA